MLLFSIAFGKQKTIANEISGGQHGKGGLQTGTREGEDGSRKSNVGGSVANHLRGKCL
jgi:hypothetical protein